MTRQNLFLRISDITPDEMAYLQNLTAGLNEEQLQTFLRLYYDRRKKSQDILLFTLLGFLGFAGIQRFVLDQIAMGIIYFLTCGFCFIGTIIDLVNNKSLTDEYNRKVANQTMALLQ